MLNGWVNTRRKTTLRLCRSHAGFILADQIVHLRNKYAFLERRIYSLNEIIRALKLHVMRTVLIYNVCQTFFKSAKVPNGRGNCRRKTASLLSGY